MKEEIKSKLDAILRKKKEKEKQLADKELDERLQREAVNIEFERICDETIVPAMEEMGESLKARGFTYKIARIRGDSGRYKDSKIFFKFANDEDSASLHNPGQHPHFAVYCDHSKGSVTFHESTMMPRSGGYSGSCGKATLDQLTIDMLQTKMLETITKALKA